jgi:hypothetical protein
MRWFGVNTTRIIYKIRTLKVLYKYQWVTKCKHKGNPLIQAPLIKINNISIKKLPCQMAGELL